MKDEWYGDNRDLVKWGVLAELANRHNINRILQVLYYRPSDWKGLQLDGEEVQLPNAVQEHFRNVLNIRSMKIQAMIEVVDTLFENRDDYLALVLDKVRSAYRGNTIVFLDPDTGLEPQNSGPTHVLRSEVSAIWREMVPGEILVFYQHQPNRNGDPWIEPKKNELEDALGVPHGFAKIAVGPKIARDVAFYYCEKPVT